MHDLLGQSTCAPLVFGNDSMIMVRHPSSRPAAARERFARRPGHAAVSA